MEALLPSVVVGLGNPGGEYATTRHNIGWMVLDQVLAGIPRAPATPRHQAASWLWECTWGGRRLWLLKPLTFMNLSGQAVRRLLTSAGLPPAELLVISDDADLPLGRLRFRTGGGSGGHHGLQSVIDELGSQEFARLRVGIGRSAGQAPIKEHVLSEFGPAELPLLGQVVRQAGEAVCLVLCRGLAEAMNRYNGMKIAAEPQPGEAKEQES